jgi:hypothetical protein
MERAFAHAKRDTMRERKRERKRDARQEAGGGCTTV